MLNRTVNYANRSQCPQRHAAMVLKGGRVLSIGNNKYHNDPKMYPVEMFDDDMNSISVHAEIDAMRNMKPKMLRGATIYVARITPGGNIGNSRPCPRCEKALNDAGVRKVIYTDNADLSDNPFKEKYYD